MTQWVRHEYVQRCVSIEMEDMAHRAVAETFAAAHFVGRLPANAPAENNFIISEYSVNDDITE
eukprot:6464830-Amphidinium_carterae.1